MQNHRGCILCVDGQPGICLLFATLLNNMGFEVETAHSSIEGLAKAQAKRFDLCIINGDLHHDSALDMYHQIRANNLLFPIIFTSPDDLPKEIVETIYTGENHFLSLPFEVDVLEALALKLAGSSLMRIAGA